MFKNDNHTEADTIIGPSVQVEGELSSQGNIHIEGAVNGSIETTANLTVGEGARITANVKALNAHIAGQLKGNLVVQEKLELATTSKIEGDVVAKILVITEGAQLDGRCQMGSMSTPVVSGGRGNKKSVPAIEQE
jgi:cytoskeletal protein CcmA (bactofilin family)